MTGPNEVREGLVARAKAAIETLANTAMGMPLSKWGDISNDLLAVIDQFRADTREIERLQRIERNRDMWHRQCLRQAEELRRLREHGPDEPDPDQLRYDRDERQRLAKEYPDAE
jgi:hypothetical protein